MIKVKMKSLREQYAPLLKELNGAIYQSKLHIESSEAISILLAVIDSYNTSMKEDLQIQVDMQGEINEKQRYINELLQEKLNAKSKYTR